MANMPCKGNAGEGGPDGQQKKSQGSGATRGNAKISGERIQQLGMRARVQPAAGDKKALLARAASATTGKSMVPVARATSGE